MEKKRICELIKKSSNPLILISENPDLDSVSGAMGLYLFLKKNGKKPKLVCSSDIPEKLLFLDRKDIFDKNIEGECLYKISISLNESQIRELSYAQEGKTLRIDFATLGAEFDLKRPEVGLARFSYDLVFVIGSSDLRSLGKVYFENTCFFSEAAIINIDSSEQNDMFGSINIVQPHSSVSGMLADIAMMFSRDAFDGDLANLFLAGIIAKTDNLRLTKIDGATFDVFSTLIKTGADKDEVIRRLKKLKSLSEEKIEFYPSLTITKQAVDSMNKSLPWQLRIDKERLEEIERTKSSSGRKIYYFAAMLGAIPGLLFISQGNLAIAPLSKIGDNYIASNNINNADSQEKKSAIDISAAQSRISIASSLVKIDQAIQTKVGVPKKISVPALGINAAVQEVGLTPGGEMGTPSNFKSVGWFKLGVRPGETGNAVVAGHLDTNTDNGGVFWSLNKIKANDYVFVTDEYGKERRFRVIKTDIYKVDKAPMDQIFGASSKAKFNLITCDGAWDNGKKSYNKRLVVYTEYDPV